MGSPPGAVRPLTTRTHVAALWSIARDRASGATALTARLLRTLRPTFRSLRMDPNWRVTLRETAGAVLDAQPAMGAFQRWARWLLQGTSAPSRREALRRLTNRLRAEGPRLREEGPRAVRTAIASLPPDCRVMTISHSALVESTLLGAQKRGALYRATVLRSEPGGEGRALARALRARGVRTRLIPDREAPRALGDVDLVLIGADAVYGSGSVVHKTGTRRLAEAAARRGVPLYVVTGRSKYAGLPAPPRNPPPLYDVTPARRVRAYWTDVGTVESDFWRSLGDRLRETH